MGVVADVRVVSERVGDDDAVIARIRAEVETFCSRFPVPGISA